MSAAFTTRLIPLPNLSERAPLYCYATRTTVEDNGMRPGYDCRCSGCMAWLAMHGPHPQLRRGA